MIPPSQQRVYRPWPCTRLTVWSSGNARERSDSHSQAQDLFFQVADEKMRLEFPVGVVLAQSVLGAAQREVLSILAVLVERKARGHPKRMVFDSIASDCIFIDSFFYDPSRSC